VKFLVLAAFSPSGSTSLSRAAASMLIAPMYSRQCTRRMASCSASGRAARVPWSYTRSRLSLPLDARVDALLWMSSRRTWPVVLRTKLRVRSDGSVRTRENAARKACAPRPVMRRGRVDGRRSGWARLHTRICLGRMAGRLIVRSCPAFSRHLPDTPLHTIMHRPTDTVRRRLATRCCGIRPDGRCVVHVCRPW
jgi:hypothetical protein